MAILQARGLAALGLLRGAPLGLGGNPALRRGEVGRAGVEIELAAHAVDHRGRAALQRQKRGARADQGRQTEGAGEDGGVRGRAALGDGQPDDAGHVDGCGVRGCQVVGDEDAGLLGQVTQMAQLQRRFQLRQHPAADVAQIGGAPGEHRVAQRGELAGHALHGVVP